MRYDSNKCAVCQTGSETVTLPMLYNANTGATKNPPSGGWHRKGVQDEACYVVHSVWSKPPIWLPLFNAKTVTTNSVERSIGLWANHQQVPAPMTVARQRRILTGLPPSTAGNAA